MVVRTANTWDSPHAGTVPDLLTSPLKLRHSQESLEMTQLNHSQQLTTPLKKSSHPLFINRLMR